MKTRKYGSICHPGGRTLEITSAHSEWLDWATKTLYQAAEREKMQGHYSDLQNTMETMKGDAVGS
jgi:hypothetical protein